LNKFDKYIKLDEELKSKYKFLINGDDYLKLTDKERNKAI
jgi:hypothetical protein